MQLNLTQSEKNLIEELTGVESTELVGMQKYLKEAQYDFVDIFKEVEEVLKKGNFSSEIMRKSLSKTEIIFKNNKDLKHSFEYLFNLSLDPAISGLPSNLGALIDKVKNTYEDSSTRDAALVFIMLWVGFGINILSRSNLDFIHAEIPFSLLLFSAIKYYKLLKQDKELKQRNYYIEIFFRQVIKILETKLVES